MWIVCRNVGVYCIRCLWSVDEETVFTILELFTITNDLCISLYIAVVLSAFGE